LIFGAKRLTLQPATNLLRMAIFDFGFCRTYSFGTTFLRLAPALWLLASCAWAQPADDLRRRGEQYYEKGEYDQAVQVFGEAIRLKLDSAEAFYDEDQIQGDTCASRSSVGQKADSQADPNLLSGRYIGGKAD